MLDYSVHTGRATMRKLKVDFEIKKYGEALQDQRHWDCKEMKREIIAEARGKGRIWDDYAGSTLIGQNWRRMVMPFNV